jgi:CDGSH-type Zn-finger protein
MRECSGGDFAGGGGQMARAVAILENDRRVAGMEPKIAQESPIVQAMKPGKYWWCACGHSKAQPFCDGSHKGTGFGPKEVEITEAKTVAWCGCKHSKTAPFCDGSHARFA